MRDLENCRQEIDEIDAELVRLFERRMGVCRDVALYKQAHYMDILNAAREEAVLKSRAQQAGDPALAQSVMALFTEIMRLSREEQRRYLEEQTETKRIAYSGVPGAYSECAVVGFFGDDCERVNFKTFEEVFAAVADGKARYGVVPVENSSSGSINDVYDLLGKYACHIVGEQLVRVEHCLLGVPGAKVDEITQVFSHEQGFAQCPKFLGEHPAWVTTPYFNTAIAARHVAEMGDKHCAAIASRLAAKHYGLEILAPDIHTFNGNHTRFIVVSASPTPIGIPDKATVTFTLRHERADARAVQLCGDGHEYDAYRVTPAAQLQLGILLLCRSDGQSARQQPRRADGFASGRLRELPSVGRVSGCAGGRPCVSRFCSSA